ncbi:MAG: peptide chain release factor N(5)-glutamine methyltransferase [Gemmatimonadetes bacterium]|nr:peptide chain release factor N(5)-glutamine methyltransferase [Gemmatimonadota bacterium]
MTFGAFEPGQSPRSVPTGITGEGASFGELVAEVEVALGHAGVEAPRTEARDLVAAVLDRPRFWPNLNAAQRATPQEREAITRAARRRAAGAPFAYAVGRAAFRFLNLDVDERVLIPRPETERLVDLVLASPQARRGKVAVDVGTGSGAIALALAAEGHFERVIATDVSADALAVARNNAAGVRDSLRVSVDFRMGSGFAPLRGERVDVVVSNPPYIAWNEVHDLPRLVRDWEPTQALCCDDDGLAVTRLVVAGAGRHLQPGGLLALEVDCRRAHTVARLIEASGAFAETRVLPDYTGRDRFVMASCARLD